MPLIMQQNSILFNSESPGWLCFSSQQPSHAKAFNKLVTLNMFQILKQCDSLNPPSILPYLAIPCLLVSDINHMEKNQIYAHILKIINK